MHVSRIFTAHLTILEHAGLVAYDEPFDGPAEFVARNSTPSIGWPLMGDIHEIAESDQPFICRTLVELDFTALDT